MCDVCVTEGIDWKFKTGNKRLQKAKLYKVYVNQVATVNVCHIHSIELFNIGERRFLNNHLPLAMKMATEKSNFSSGL